MHSWWILVDHGGLFDSHGREMKPLMRYLDRHEWGLKKEAYLQHHPKATIPSCYRDAQWSTSQWNWITNIYVLLMKSRHFDCKPIKNESLQAVVSVHFRTTLCKNLLCNFKIPGRPCFHHCCRGEKSWVNLMVGTNFQGQGSMHIACLLIVCLMPQQAMIIPDKPQTICTSRKSDPPTC